MDDKLANRIKPPKKEERLKNNIKGPPYSDLGQKYDDIINWYLVNYRRREKGLKDESINDLAELMDVEVDEIQKITHSADFIDVFGIRTRKNALMMATLMDPVANDIIREMMTSKDPNERKKGLELHLKRQDQLGIKDIDIRKDLSSKTDPDDLLKDTWGLIRKLFDYSWANGKECTCGAYLDPVRFFEGLKKEGPAYLEGTIQEDVVQDLGEIQRSVGSRPKGPS